MYEGSINAIARKIRIYQVLLVGQANLLRPPSLLHQGSPIIVATGQAQIMVCRVGLAAASSCCPKDHPALEAHLLR
jgi:hypothetical protein